MFYKNGANFLLHPFIMTIKIVKCKVLNRRGHYKLPGIKIIKLSVTGGCKTLIVDRLRFKNDYSLVIDIYITLKSVLIVVFCWLL